MEWLPWVGRHAMAAPRSQDEWQTVLRDRFQKHLRGIGLPMERALEVFTITAWGTVPAFEQIISDFPSIDQKLSRLRIPMKADTDSDSYRTAFQSIRTVCGVK
jgi:hypothetical protein